jgi:hypothetical protein
MSWHFEEFVTDVVKMIEGGASDRQIEVFLGSVLAADRPRVLAEARKRARPGAPDHEGASEREVGDRTGPGAGYDDEPSKVKDRGGVS